MNVRIIVEMFVDNLIDRDDLYEFYKNDLLKCAQQTAESEGLFGITNAEYTILNVEEVK